MLLLWRSITGNVLFSSAVTEYNSWWNSKTQQMFESETKEIQLEATKELRAEHSDF